MRQKRFSNIIVVTRHSRFAVFPVLFTSVLACGHAETQTMWIMLKCRPCGLSVIFIYKYFNFSCWTLINVVNTFTGFPLLLIMKTNGHD